MGCECADHAAAVGDHGMYGRLKAEFEVNVPWKTVELTAYWCLLTKNAIGPTMVSVYNKDGLWRGEVKCIGPKAKGTIC